MSNEVLSAKDALSDFIDTDTFDDYLQTAYWDDNFNSDKALDLMLRWCDCNGIELTDLDTLNYDALFFNAYRCSEKGLS